MLAIKAWNSEISDYQRNLGLLYTYENVINVFLNDFCFLVTLLENSWSTKNTTWHSIQTQDVANERCESTWEKSGDLC